MTAAEISTSPLSRVLKRPGVRQFVKFCVVGASSTLIDFGVYLSLIELLHLDHLVKSALHLQSPDQALNLARPLAQTISFLLAVTNGFIWNNRWTFRTHGEGDARKRYGKFVLTNVIGLILNLTILSLVVHTVSPGVVEWVRSMAPLKDPAGLLGKMVATAVVLGWNFTASKYWTFKS